MTGSSLCRSSVLSSRIERTCPCILQIVFANAIRTCSPCACAEDQPLFRHAGGLPQEGPLAQLRGDEEARAERVQLHAQELRPAHRVSLPTLP